MKLKIRVTPDFERQVDHLRDWWKNNRTAAQSLKTRIREALVRIQTSPDAAPVYEELQGRTVRRILLKSTPYHIYYYVDIEAAEAVLIAAWSGMREELPSF